MWSDKLCARCSAGCRISRDCGRVPVGGFTENCAARITALTAWVRVSCSLRCGVPLVPGDFSNSSTGIILKIIERLLYVLYIDNGGNTTRIINTINSYYLL